METIFHALVGCDFVKAIWGKIGIQVAKAVNGMFGDWVAEIFERENASRRAEVAMGSVDGSKFSGVEAKKIHLLNRYM